MTAAWYNELDKQGSDAIPDIDPDTDAQVTPLVFLHVEFFF